MDGLEDEFASRRDSIARGSVSIAAGGSTLQYILPPFIDRFVHEYPLIDLRLHNVTGKEGLAALRAGEIDIAVGPMLDAPHDILFEPFAKSRLTRRRSLAMPSSGAGSFIVVKRML